MERLTRDIFVIGASAGGVQALTELCRGLPRDLPAALFVVMHTPSTGPGFLAQILDRAGPMAVEAARDGNPVVPGRMLIAPPDYHLLLYDGLVRLTRGPRENGFRPAVDPLFRTAAEAYGPRVVGVVLSGGLDDGTEGLIRIREGGGIAIVQDPAEASIPDMPLSALSHADCNFVLSVAGIAAKLIELAHEPVPLTRRSKTRNGTAKGVSMRNGGRPRDRAAFGKSSLRMHDLPGAPSALTCPECNGALWEIKRRKLVRYQCHVGHGYTESGLIDAQQRSVEAAMWGALRALEECADLRRRMARRASRGTLRVVADEYQRQAEDYERQAEVIRDALSSAQGNMGLKPAPRPEGSGIVRAKSPPRQRAKVERSRGAKASAHNGNGQRRHKR